MASIPPGRRLTRSVAMTKIYQSSDTVQIVFVGDERVQYVRV